VRKLGLTAVYVAKELGVSPSSVSKSIVRGRQALKNEAIEEYLLESQ
jgi:predicted transcriptional regulator